MCCDLGRNDGRKILHHQCVFEELAYFTCSSSSAKLVVFISLTARGETTVATAMPREEACQQIVGNAKHIPRPSLSLLRRELEYEKLHSRRKTTYGPCFYLESYSQDQSK